MARTEEARAATAHGIALGMKTTSVDRESTNSKVFRTANEKASAAGKKKRIMPFKLAYRHYRIKMLAKVRF